VAAAREAAAIIREGIAAERWKPSPKETQWLGRIDQALDALPASETALIAEMNDSYGSLYDRASYGLDTPDAD
jgi:hypothetical protein